MLSPASACIHKLSKAVAIEGSGAVCLPSRSSDELPLQLPHLSAHNMSVRRWSRSAKWILLGSGLDKEDTKLLVSFANLSGSRLVKRWSAEVSHVICHLDEHNRAM